jgi:NitT/TauT family transport system substrate-binding protein
MVRLKRKILAAALLLVAFPVVMASCTLLKPSPPTEVPPSPTQVKSVSMRLPIPTADTAFAPYYLCMDKGICAKHGIELKLEPGSPELNPVKMLSQGVNQFAVVGGPEILLTARSKGAPIVGIGLTGKDANFVTLLALKKSGINKIQDLEGKKVGFFYGHISTDVLRMTFKKENVQVQELDTGFDYGQLISGKVDAQWAFRSTAGLALPAKGVEVVQINPSDYGITTQGYVLMTSEKMRKEQPQVVQSFMNAMIESTQYSVEHEQEAIDATVKRDPAFKPEFGKKQLAIYNAAIKNNKQIGIFAAEDMQKTKDQMLSTQLIPENLDLQSAYTNQFVEQYYKAKP